MSCFVITKCDRCPTEKKAEKGLPHPNNWGFVLFTRHEYNENGVLTSKKEHFDLCDKCLDQLMDFSHENRKESNQV